MTRTSAAIPALTIAIISGHSLVALGFQKIFESGKSDHVVQSHQRMTPDVLLAEREPDVFVLDMDTERDPIGIIKQIRESALTSKIVLLSGVEDEDRMREAFAYGVDGIILKIQPPAVVLAVMEALHAPTMPPARVERDGAGLVARGTPFTKTVESRPLPPAWPDALTEREREIIRLVGQGLSNKEIAYKLSISDSTVRHHMTNIFDKVGVPNRQKLLIHTNQFRSAHV